ncbi:LuxR C-terminal-related transcriptional regulator [Gordonia sp. NB41Y]|uniref:helix-turn-helix transcriptional regulator n=1 Tax=Gordonia sp. NB41Y TaxID=875808 RepID=UPI0002BD4BC4|nr:LuxR C-terminal-related transcriptional regulator [Gordonia sp. NB41Y]EMP14015.1 hypothetical protein ISGA_650 [Gordonia sp. NB41Y]WLP88696.1 LuxR C-terminal-related transcriptional regulator [Gordonia sp. NB41Y]
MSAPRDGNLPVELTTFVGRRESITQAKNLFAGGRLLTLVGTGGVGKSRFALRMARDLRRDFPDGAWLVELADLGEGTLLAQTVGAALGVRSEMADATDNLITYLRDRRLLLILDNCEHLIDDCIDLASRILHACATVKIIATSRQVLGIDGEQAFPVPPLTYDVTAGHLRSTTVLQATDRTRVDRHRTLAAATDWSYQLCTPDERRLWEQLSVFACGFTVDAAVAICLPDPGDDATVAVADTADTAAHRDAVLQALIGLVDKSVISRSGTAGQRRRYRVLEPVRQYGADRLAESPDARMVHQRHRDYYFRFAQRVATEHGSDRDIDWYVATRAEHANLREALAYSLKDADDARYALEMATVLAPFWQQSSSIREGYEWICTALGKVTSPCRERAAGLVAASIFGFLLLEVDDARALLREHRELLAQLGLPDDSMVTLQALALETFIDGDIDRSLAFAERAVERGIAGENPGRVSEVMALAVLYAIVFENEKAERLAEHFLEFTEQHDSQLLKVVAMFPLGAVRWRKGDLDSAISLMRDAISLSDELDNPGPVAVGIEGLAWVTADSDPERAATLLGAAGALWQYRQMPFAQEAVHRITAKVEADLRKSLGDKEFEQRTALGRELSYQDVVALSLESNTDARPRNRAKDADLTQREGEVAALVADGLTNKQIATKLVISPRTVDPHVEHIFTKLGFRSRTRSRAG